ncbi:uncharacterized protein HMPREF1541_08873 [Cyphellophora europaea CBS 101466]|uniref:RBR-type E3 ubiquitin transferase n=1 Tax=Cyphellophora europaea (strain CBS 101466) TaxID=1220924 RepID=W2RJS3_CYPE1|nr:uncharacterized protein HMPREF1541_08873 [Cyphellophora europaea CBS 101466]ETN36595.1 hypothetical protein HMPREF1541_08873 [Cyphellophora europaea CBS 101466]
MDDFDADDERAIELSSIEAIYPELQVSPESRYNASLDLAVTPLNPLKIHFQEVLTDLTHPQLPTPSSNDHARAVAAGARDKNGRDATHGGIHELEHLPPLHLKMQLPDKYPAEYPPKIELTVSPCWLSQRKLDELKAECVRLWEEIGHDQVIYLFIDHLQQQAENAFGLADGQAVSMPADLRLELLDYDLKARRRKFENETFDCQICIEPKKGKDCHRLFACGHVFCISCLQDSYNTYISEGDVGSIKCLDPTCEKQRETSEPKRKKRRRDYSLNPSELLQIPIDQELVQRYVRLKRKQRLESDKNTIYCPRQWCQGAARSKKHPKHADLFGDFSSDDASGSEAEPEPESNATAKKRIKKKDEQNIPMARRLAVCEDCDFAFCSVCKKGWHGELVYCNPRKQKELEAEEKATLEYLERYSTPCPTCQAPCQKTHGCNHMICFRCKTHFCYLCCSWLNADNPYQHFNNPKNNCYMRLWELEQGDGTGEAPRIDNRWGEVPDEIDEDDFDQDDRDQQPIDMAALAQEVEVIAANPVGDVVDHSDDEEVAPDVVRNRRARAIEFVNFAANGQQQAQRVILPDQIEEPAGPLQPLPRQLHDQQEGRAARRARQRRRRQQQLPNGRANARAPIGARIAHQNLPPAAPQLPANNLPAAPPALQGDQAALQRFLELAQRDEEDEWDMMMKKKEEEEEKAQIEMRRPR